MDKGLERARALVSYMERQFESGRAAVSPNHLAQLSHIANISAAFLPASFFACDKISLHDFGAVDMFIRHANKRINDGSLREDWDETLKVIFDQKGIELEPLPS